MLTHGELTADCRSARFTFPYSMSNLWCRPLIAGRAEHEQTELRYQFRCSDSVIFHSKSYVFIIYSLLGRDHRNNPIEYSRKAYSSKHLLSLMFII